MQKITPFLWFDSQAEEAANFYVEVFKDGKITEVSRYDENSAKASGQTAGSAMVVAFEINGQQFSAINGGPIYKFNEAISFMVSCKDQAEIDYFWEKLSAVPESEQCGWCKDKFGLSWQIVPENMGQLIGSPASMQAMLNMKKIDINGLKNAG